MKGKVTVRLKAGVLDVEGKAIEGALAKLGFNGVGAVRVGKVFEVELAETDPAAAKAALTAMAKGLLANPVMETFEVALEPG
ncbi:MAG: phosphoribosylformylglycinamidine synthase subunit PurS [Myxococcales bacterium]|nr:phosphoribosylformylglycinamidine synthase subunit PurS [Myxococcales bacterium]MCB9522097.1 phosphoribosylformylglycinamidine synthase subunit PurS [Myxococcales bacterium]